MKKHKYILLTIILILSQFICITLGKNKKEVRVRRQLELPSQAYVASNRTYTLLKPDYLYRHTQKDIFNK